MGVDDREAKSLEIINDLIINKLTARRKGGT